MLLLLLKLRRVSRRLQLGRHWESLLPVLLCFALRLGPIDSFRWQVAEVLVAKLDSHIVQHASQHRHCNDLWLATTLCGVSFCHPCLCGHAGSLRKGCWRRIMRISAALALTACTCVALTLRVANAANGAVLGSRVSRLVSIRDRWQGCLSAPPLSS